jgi:hypothetical protein
MIAARARLVWKHRARNKYRTAGRARNARHARSHTASVVPRGRQLIDFVSVALAVIAPAIFVLNAAVHKCPLDGVEHKTDLFGGWFTCHGRLAVGQAVGTGLL